MRVPIILLIALCVGVWSGRAGAQEPTATVTATPSAATPELTPTPSVTPTPVEPAAPPPPAPVPAVPAAEETAAPAAETRPTATPTSTPSTTVAAPKADRTPVPSRRRTHAPNTERRLGSIEPHATATPDATTTTPAPGPGPAPASAPILPGPAAAAVPNFFIDRFRIPPFLLPIYQAAGTQYGIRWEVLAAINEIETDYGRNLNVSSAGALGWMQFMPTTWKQFGVDANRDGVKDPFNPVDAIFASARYLRAAGATRDLRRAIFAYNHADWYVDSVLLRARVVAGLPWGLVNSLTGLTQGTFPVRGRSSYGGKTTGMTRRGIDVYATIGAPVIAVADGRVGKLGVNRRLGRYVQLQDVYGNTYTYAHLGHVARTYRAPRRRGTPAAAGTRAATMKRRLYAHPGRPTARFSDAGGAWEPRDFERRRLRVGSRVIVGTELGRIAGKPPHLRFEIRPAGRDAPRIDPKPILDGWKLLESTAIYRPEIGRPPLRRNAGEDSIGEIMLMSKDALARRVLADRRIHIYTCGRHDIETGQIDRRVLATLEFLAASGLDPTVSSLVCGHGRLTSSGNVSEHVSGNAVDIAAVNGIAVLGHQGKGSISDATVRGLLTLQGAIKPHQIISLMTVDGTDNTFAMADHDDQIHVGFRPRPVTEPLEPFAFGAALESWQWIKMMQRLSTIDNPIVARSPSRYALDVNTREGQ
jgi:murein DD-endopeptidase MepM/ murein hydrolase activator NlpD